MFFVSRYALDRLSEYKARHQEVWPEMLDALRSAGWRNYSLFLRDDGLLVGYLEPTISIGPWRLWRKPK